MPSGQPPIPVLIVRNLRPGLQANLHAERGVGAHNPKSNDDVERFVLHCLAVRKPCVQLGLPRLLQQQLGWTIVAARFLGENVDDRHLAQRNVLIAAADLHVTPVKHARGVAAGLGDKPWCSSCGAPTRRRTWVRRTCRTVLVVVVLVFWPERLSFASSSRMLPPFISRMMEWWTRRSTAAAVVMGSLKMRSH